MHKPLIGIGSDVLHKEGERDRAFVYTTYIESLKRAGAVPVLIPPQPENAADLAETLDGIVLAGGDDCDPAEDGEEKHPRCEPMDPRRQKMRLPRRRARRSTRAASRWIRGVRRTTSAWRDWPASAASRRSASAS